MNVNEAWDRMYEKGRNGLEVRGSVKEYIDAYLRFTKNPSEIKVLDFGCGNGKNMIYMLEKKLNVRGFDLSKEGVIKTRKNLEDRLSMGKD
ncbi:class I SAM-dependent methyltransferase [Candidatus Woesearchaeota archaeon]|nr:class I SAM-dependent methyltransferase [Candidatus Woesearchaeota archaeon]